MVQDTQKMRKMVERNKLSFPDLFPNLITVTCAGEAGCVAISTARPQRMLLDSPTRRKCPFSGRSIFEISPVKIPSWNLPFMEMLSHQIPFYENFPFIKSPPLTLLPHQFPFSRKFPFVEIPPPWKSPWIDGGLYFCSWTVCRRRLYRQGHMAVVLLDVCLPLRNCIFLPSANLAGTSTTQLLSIAKAGGGFFATLSCPSEMISTGP